VYYIARAFYRKAKVTLVQDEGNWRALVGKVDFDLCPNTAVLSAMGPSLIHNVSLFPVAIIDYWTEEYVENVLKAVRYLSQQPRRRPSALVGRYYKLEFGWIREKDKYMDFSPKAWLKVSENVWPGYRIQKWSASRGDIEGDFIITRLNDDSLAIDSPSAKNTQIIPKSEFCHVAEYWEEYKLGMLPRNKVSDMTRYSTYIIGILHWLDKERLLEE
jgi:hypothetical protein